MKLLSSVDNWNSLFEWSSVALVALTVIAGAGTIITSRIINKRQSRDILELRKGVNDSKTDLAKALTKQAETELALEKLKAAQGQRMITGTEAEVFQKTLDGKPKAKVEIWFEPKNDEAFTFASSIWYQLQHAGWDASSPIPIPELPFERPNDAGLSLDMRATGGLPFSLFIATKDIPENRPDSGDQFPFSALYDAFIAIDKPPGAGDARRVTKDIPKGTLRIIVGAKP